MNDLIKRIISGLIYVIIFLLCVFFSEKTYIGLIVVFAGISLWEFSKLINLRNIIPYILLPIVVYIPQNYNSEKVLLTGLIITLLCSFRLIYSLYQKGKRFPKTFLGKMNLSILYIIFPFTFLILLPFVNGKYNPIWPPCTSLAQSTLQTTPFTPYTPKLKRPSTVLKPLYSKSIHSISITLLSVP